MKQTAVEWFVSSIAHGGLVTKKQFSELVEQAKAMEKEQIIEANENKMPFITGEEYYNETFKDTNK